DVGIRVCSSLGSSAEECTGEDMGDARAEGDSPIQLVPGVSFDRLAHVRSRHSGLVASDQSAGDIVDTVLGVCQTEIQVLPDHEQTAMQSDGDAAAIGNKVLPAELIGDPEPIVGVGIHDIEGVVNAVRRILVAAGKVVAAEDPRYPW